MRGCMGKALFEKIWDKHLVHDLGDGFGLIFVDRQLLTELAAPQFDQLEKRGLPLLYPECTFAVSDHTVPTLRNGKASATERATSWTRAMREKAGKIRLYAFRHR